MKANINNTNNNAANCTLKTQQTAPTFGDLCWDSYGKSSVIVFGNIDDHQEQLTGMGGKRIDAKYSALQIGRKWSEKMGRTDAYIFSSKQRENVCKYVAKVNKAIFDAALWYEDETVKQAASYQVGERVVTVHGKGTITEHVAKYGGGKCRCVKLDKFTYNYGWEGMPQTFIEVGENEMRPEAA